MKGGGIMAFQIPEYHHPDFSEERFLKAPDARWEVVEMDGVAPEYFHSTSMFPEYFKIQGKWVLAEESRMDSSVVISAVSIVCIVIMCRASKEIHGKIIKNS